jgi:hypothetical protein
MLTKRRKGQVLVVAALAIALTILTTQAYVYELNNMKISSEHGLLSDYILGIKQESRHVVTASLVNVSHGGAASNFEANLERWEVFVAGGYSLGRCDLNATLASSTTYSDGIRLDWGANGSGVSSACADFALNLGGRGVEVDWGFTVNMTSRVEVSGSYDDLGDDSKQVSVSVNLENEGASALAWTIVLEYLKSGSWEDPKNLGSYAKLDSGNGTYRYTFIDTIPGTFVRVRVRVNDLRGVFVETETSLPSG